MSNNKKARSHLKGSEAEAGAVGDTFVVHSENYNEQRLNTGGSEQKLNIDIDENDMGAVAGTKPKLSKKTKRNFIILLILLLVVLIVVIVLPATLIVRRLDSPNNLRQVELNVVWDLVSGSNGYIVEINGRRYDAETNQLSITHLNPGTRNVRVRALHNSARRNSNFSAAYNLIIVRQSLNVIQDRTIVVERYYDGTDIYTGDILLGIHYELDPLRHGTNVDITITGKRFNNANVIYANSLIVNYSATLTGTNASHYIITSGYFTLNARILQRPLEIEVPSLTKQFGDSDALIYTVRCYELNNDIEVNFIREPGEAIGIYNIVDAWSSNTNYFIQIKPDTGIGRFEIIQRVIEVRANQGIVLTKAFDGTATFDLDNLSQLPTIYTIENLVPGFGVGIVLTTANFNNQNVAYANIVRVNFSAALIDPNGVYRVIQSYFDIEANIMPRRLLVAPNHFSREFGDTEISLEQYFYDTELGINHTLTFIRAEGNTVGVYDIVSVAQHDSNYEFVLIENSGIGRFTIDRRTITVVATDALIQKTFDGNQFYIGMLTQGTHFILQNALPNFEVDINIAFMLFNSANVLNAEYLRVQFLDSLIDPHGVYRIVAGEFMLNAMITPKIIEIEPLSISRQFGETDNLDAVHFNDTTDTFINLTFQREAGELVGEYRFIGATSHNPNFAFTLLETDNRFTITRRQIEVLATGESLTKVFDNTTDSNHQILVGVHFTFSNTTNGNVPNIIFTQRFNVSDITATSIILTISGLSAFYDRYELINLTLAIPATITPRHADVIPQFFDIQYGDPDYLWQTFVCNFTSLSFTVEFTRQAGNAVGFYDILSATPANPNFVLNVVDGAGKFIISPRILQVEVIPGTTFSRQYDGTTNMNMPILQGTHFNLHNLIGGIEVSLSIISRQFDSKDAGVATRVIVMFNAVLEGSTAGNFITTGGTMEFAGIILPRQLTVTPDLFEKDFLSHLDLTQYVQCVSGIMVPVSFLSTAGENHLNTYAGTYDIVEVRWISPNHAFTLAPNSGLGRFIIHRIHLIINATDRNTVFNWQGQSIFTPTSVPARTLRVQHRLQAQSDTHLTYFLPTNAGTYLVRVFFDGDQNFLPQFIDRTLFIDRAESVITNTSPNDYVFNGTIRPITATLNHDEADLVFSRNDFINAGTHTAMISVPQTVNFRATSIVVNFVIARYVVNNANIAFPTAGNITFGQSLHSSALTGGSTLGNFAWVNPSTNPQVSDTQFQVIFSPFDTDNFVWDYVVLVRYVNITVNRFIVTEIAFPTATGVVIGNALSTSTLIGTSEFGIFTWQTPNMIPTNSGNFNVVFTPHDEDNFDFTAITRIRTVFVEVSFRTFFVTNGGSEVETMIMRTLTEAPFTHREGFVFDGWFLDSMLMQRATFPLNITQDTILYAGWSSEGLVFIHRGNSFSVMLDPTTVDAIVFIPAYYRGLPVTAIEDEGFMNATAIEVVIIPHTVTVIGHRAFAGCVNLMFVQIINSIENIQFGIDWINTGFIYGTGVNFNVTACPGCDGTIDFCQPDCGVRYG